MADHIFTDITTLQEHYPFLSTVEFSVVKPHVKFAERRYIPELMDDVTWGTLLDEIDNNRISDARWTALIDYTRDALAFLTTMHYVPHGNVRLAQGNLVVTDNDRTKPASKDRKNDLMRGLLEQSVEHLDQVIKHLNANTTFFTNYANSTQYEASQASLINFADDFNELYPLGTNRWAWRSMKPWKRRAEKTRIIGTLGQTYYNELIAQSKAGTLTADNLAIYDECREALAFATVEGSLENMAIRIEEGAITVYNNASQPADDIRTNANATTVQKAVDNCKEEATRIMRSVEDTLRTDASATKYPTFFNSTKYVAPADQTEINEEGDTIFNAL
jgi:hypothetical protein